MAMNFTFVKEHPYAIGGLLLGGFLLFVLLRSKASAAVTTTGSAQSAGLPASVVQSQLEAGAAIQTAQLQQAQQVNDENFQLALAAQKNAADYATAQLNAQTSTAQQVNAITGSTNIATIQAGVQNNAISTQASVINEQTQTGLQAALAGDQLQLSADQLQQAAAMGTAQINANQNVSLAQIAADRDTAIANTTATAQVDLGALAANTQTTVAQIGGQVAMAQIQGGVSVAQMQLQNQSQENQRILDLVKSGQLNKGGEGGANQLAAIAAATGQPSIAGSAYGTATASLSDGNSTGGILNSISGIFGTVGNGITKGLKAVAT